MLDAGASERAAIALRSASRPGLSDSKIKARFAKLGATGFAGSPSAFGKFITDETDKWAKLISFAGIKPV